MFNVRVSLLAFVATVAVAASITVHADTIAAPFVPPMPVKPDVPPQVSAAIGVLREACAAWSVIMVAPPSVGGAAPRLEAPPPATPERTLCAVAANPDQPFLQPTILSGIAGAALFFIGLLVFSLLREVLISAWNWRWAPGARSW